jgi:hypothetical protein
MSSLTDVVRTRWGEGGIGRYGPLQVSTAEAVDLPCMIAAIPDLSSCSTRCLTPTTWVLDNRVACSGKQISRAMIDG